MRLHCRGRRGFTLIELLVVIAIIAVLIGLLLPAVQKVRESAARSSCSNNLHQLAIACQTYHDNNGTLPSNGPDATYNLNGRNWSWLARILPFVEQDNLYKGCGIPNNTLRVAYNAGLLGTPVKSFLCPSSEAINGQPRSAVADLGVSGIGNTCYKGVCGSNWEWGSALWNPVKDPSTGNANGLDVGNGIFYRTDGLLPNPYGHGPLPISAIKDGTSNTFMIGEDLPDLNYWCAWPYSNAAVGTCAIYPNNALVAGQPGFGNPGDWPDIYSFRSNHAQGLNFATADGSVHFINDNININLYRALATYKGGEVASVP
jgi:prepilin-type N-terminal cleavage/methylation domain-containing protein